MASFKIKHPVEALRAETVVVSGRFAPAGTGAPTYPDSGKNRGWSVARTSEGLYTVTFANFNWIALEGLSLTVREAAGVATIVQGGDWNNSAGTLGIRVLQETADGAGTDDTFELADLAADADNEISFVAIFRTSST